MSRSSNKEYSVFVGNLEPRVTEEILWELFLQAGPLDRVYIPKDRETGKAKTFGFVEFAHEVSVPYACKLLDGISLYEKQLKVNPSASGPGGSSGSRDQSWSPHERIQEWGSYGYSTPLRREGSFGGQNGRNSPSFPMFHGNTPSPDHGGALHRSHSFPEGIQGTFSPWQQQQQQFVSRFSPNSVSPHLSGQHSPLHFQAMDNLLQTRFSSPYYQQYTPPNRGNWGR